MLLALIWKFHFSPFMVLVISVLNDGTIMTISKDIVKPSTHPDSWKLQEIFATAQQLHMAYEKKSNTEMDADDQRRLGRGKIEIKRIENTTNRQVTFCKRRNSVRETIERYKKACADTSTNGSASEITAQHYQQESAKLRNQIKTLQNSNKGYMGEGLSNIPVKDLKGMETKLEKAITRIRSKKVYLATGKLEKAITRIRSKKVYLATGIVEGIWEAVSKYTTKTCGNKGYTYKRWPYW